MESNRKKIPPVFKHKKQDVYISQQGEKRARYVEQGHNLPTLIPWSCEIPPGES